MTTERDIRNQIAYAEKRGREEGKAEGLEEGEAKGRAEGRGEGIQTVAKNLIESGMTVEFVSKATGLSADEISRLS